MPGVAGRSGRKSAKNEMLMFEVVDLAWKLALADLKNPDLDQSIKREIYSKVIVKSLPSEFIGMNMNNNTTIISAPIQIKSGELENTSRTAEYFKLADNVQSPSAA